MPDFDDATRLEGGDGRYAITLSSDYEIWGPNGGYLAAVALRAAGMEAAIKRPASISCHFISRAAFEPVRLDVRTLQKGRRAESFHVEMTQGERTVLQAIVRTSAAGPGHVHDYAVAPDVPGPDGLAPYHEIFADEGPPPFRFWLNFEGRPTAPVADVKGNLPRDPVLREWQKFVPTATFDDPFVDAGRYVLFLDTFAWPAGSGPYRSPDPPEYVAPNLDVTAWFHRPAPESEWILADHDAPISHGGMLWSQGRIWSQDRKLIASGGAQCLYVADRRGDAGTGK